MSTSEIRNKIAETKEKMSNMDENSEGYKVLSEVVNELQTTLQSLSTGGLKVHQDPNEQICESCQ